MWLHSSAFIQREMEPEISWGSFQSELFSLTGKVLSQEKWLVVFLMSYSMEKLAVETMP